MNRFLVALGAVLLAAILYLWFAWEREGFAGEDPAPASSVEAVEAVGFAGQGSGPEAGAGPDREGLAVAEADAQPSAATEAEPRWGRGRVQTPDGEPVVGAWVTTPHGGITTFTDESGSFLLPILDQEHWSDRRSYYAWAEGMTVGNVGVQWDEEALIVLESGEEGTVSVHHAGGDVPIVAARVRLAAPVYPMDEGLPLQEKSLTWIPIEVAPTDVHGATRVPGGERYLLQVEAEGYEETVVWYSADPGRTEKVELALRQQERIRLVDREGRPVANARVGFGGYAETAVSDAGGWVELPGREPERPGRIFVEHGADGWVEDLRAESKELIAGLKVVVGNRERRGDLRPGTRGAPADFEVATTSWGEDYQTRYWPNPRRMASRLTWVPVEEDGAFTIRWGWQGTTTYAIVRHRESQDLVLREELVGDGPYTLTLEETWPLTLRFTAEPGAVLEGAKVSLDPGGGGRERPRSRSLENGVAELRLLPGSYAVMLQFAGQTAFRSLGSITMPAAPHEETFELGRRRTVRGSVTAAGEPVFPATLHFSVGGEDDGEGFQAITDARGLWEVQAAPDRDCEVSVAPRERLLRGATPTIRLTASEDELHIRIPVGELEFVAVDPGTWNSEEIVGTRRQASPDTPWDSSTGRTEHLGAFVPDLSHGAQRILCAPGTYVFRPGRAIESNYEAWTPASVEVRAGQRTTVSLQKVLHGVVAIRIRGAEGRFEAGHAEARPLGDTPSVSTELLRYFRSRTRWRSGSVEAWRLPPGDWEVHLRGPLESGWRRREGQGPLVGADASWTGPVRVRAGEESVIWLRITEEGGLALAEGAD